MKNANDAPNARALSKHLPAEIMREVHIFDEVASTNGIAEHMAKEGACGGAIIIANSQTAGRGTRGRSFFCARGAGFYITFLFPGGSAPRAAESIPTVFAAVAVCRAVENKTQKRPSVKWINDIILNDKKICGILTQKIKTPRDYTIVGVGLNIVKPPEGYPEDISRVAGALFGEGEKPDFETETALLAEIILQTRLGAGDETEILDAYKKRLITLNKNVTVSDGEREFTGFAAGITNKGHLLVKTPDGRTAEIVAGGARVTA